MGRLRSLFTSTGFPLGTRGTNFGQYGQWHPEVTSQIRPRLIMRSIEKEMVQDRLKTEPFKSLYSNNLPKRSGGIVGGIFERALRDVGPRTNWKKTAGRSLIAKNAAFVRFIAIDKDCESELSLQVKTELRDKCLLYLTKIDTRVRCSWANYGDVQWRAKELAYYCQAYDFLMADADAEVLEAQELIEEKLHSLAANLFEVLDIWKEPWIPYVTSKNNKRLIAAAGLGFAALTLGHRGSKVRERSENINSRKWRPDNWIGAAMTTIYYLLRTDSDSSLVTSDGAYREGPHYFRYIANLLLPLFNAMKHFQDIRDCEREWKEMYFNFGKAWNQSVQLSNPFYYPGVLKILDYYTDIRQPEGRLPAIKDSYTDEYFPETALMAKLNKKYAWPYSSFDRMWDKCALLNTSLGIDNGADSRVDYLTASSYSAGPKPIQFQVSEFKDAGSYIFRSQSASGEFYVHLNAGHKAWGSSSHYHEDASSFIINLDGQLLALDPGYIQTKKSHLVNRARHHNLLLVSGESFTSTKQFHFQEKINRDEFYFLRISDNKNRSVSQRFRSLIVLKDPEHVLAIIYDECFYDKPKKFTSLIHGNGYKNNGTFNFFEDEHKATWQHAGLSMDVFSISLPAGRLVTGESVHDDGYNHNLLHSVLKHQLHAAKARFLTICSAHKNRPLDFTKISNSQNNITGFLISDSLVAGTHYLIFIREGQDQRIAFQIPGSDSRHEIKTDADLLILKFRRKTNILDFKILLSQNGHYIEYQANRYRMDKESGFCADFSLDE